MIIGAEANIKDVNGFLEDITNLAKGHDLVIQVFDAELIYGKNHLLSAYKKSKRAFEQKRNTTNSLEMEILLYASGERQIQKAIKKMGVKPGESKIALIIDGKIEDINKILEKLNLKRNDKILEGDHNTLKKFGIKSEEIKTVSKESYEDLVLEKIALVDIIK